MWVQCIHACVAELCSPQAGLRRAKAGVPCGRSRRPPEPEDGQKTAPKHISPLLGQRQKGFSSVLSRSEAGPPTVYVKHLIASHQCLSPAAARSGASNPIRATRALLMNCVSISLQCPSSAVLMTKPVSFKCSQSTAQHLSVHMGDRWQAKPQFQILGSRHSPHLRHRENCHRVHTVISDAACKYTTVVYTSHYSLPIPT